MQVISPRAENSISLFQIKFMPINMMLVTQENRAKAIPMSPNVMKYAAPPRSGFLACDVVADAPSHVAAMAKFESSAKAKAAHINPRSAEERFAFIVLKGRTPRFTVSAQWLCLTPSRYAVQCKLMFGSVNSHSKCNTAYIKKR